MTPYADRRRGLPTSINVKLPDVTPPSGSYTVNWAGAAATITQTALADDTTDRASLSAQSVTVTADTDRPGGSITAPAWPRYRSSWRTVRGTAADDETGVAWVGVRLIEKRELGWYTYVPSRQVWVKGGATVSSAWREARVATPTLSATGAWQLRVTGPTTGEHRIRVYGRDRVGNVSAIHENAN